MSDYQAIGGVSATLKLLLEDRMELPAALPAPADFEITIGQPRTQPPSANGRAAEPPGINLFLYQVKKNAELSNQGIPGRTDPAAYDLPPLSLNLHYMLTAYGATATSTGVDETMSHFLLGSAMRVLHDHPVITEHLLASAGAPVLHASLRGEFEQVKLYLEPLSLEDLSKVWTALTLPYRVSAAYEVKVVQIESRRPRRFPKPVGEPPPAGPRVFVMTLRSPRIAELRVRRGPPPAPELPFPVARVGDALIIRGGNFRSTGTRVEFEAIGSGTPLVDLEDDRIELLVPDDPALQPGAQSLAVVIGAPEVPVGRFRSNTAVIQLVPSVTSATPGAQRRLVVRGQRLFAESLSGETVIADVAVPKDSYVAAAPTEITVPLPDNVPAWPVPVVVSGDLAALPPFANGLDLSVTAAGETQTLSLASTPTDVAQAAHVLQRSMQGARSPAAVSRARVTSHGDRLIVVPGGLRQAVTFAPAAPSTATAELKLDAASGAAAENAYLSGALAEPVVLTSAAPRVTMSIDGTDHVAALAAVPATPAEAAAELQAAIRTGPNAAFTGARVTVLENQLLVLPGAAPATVAFSAVSGVDDTTVVELKLKGEYSARVRVNGAESFDEAKFELP